MCAEYWLPGVIVQTSVNSHVFRLYLRLSMLIQCGELCVATVVISFYAAGCKTLVLHTLEWVQCCAALWRQGCHPL